MVKSALEKIMEAFISEPARRQRLSSALLDRQGESTHAIDGGPVHLWNRTYLSSVRPRQHTVEAAAQETLGNGPQRATRFYPSDGGVVVHLRVPADAGIDFVAHVSDAALQGVFLRLLPLDEKINEDGITRPKLGRRDGRRTKLLALRGLFLSRRAEQVSNEEKESPDASRIGDKYREILRDLNAQNVLEAGQMMRDDLVRTLVEIAETQTRRDRMDLFVYHERYLAPWAKLLFLSDPRDPTRRIVPVVTMGPDGGLPLIALHAMMLPDLGEREAQLFETHGIRVFFPLRHGVLDSHAPDLSPEAHLADAVQGIEAVATTLGSDRFHLAAMVTSSKIALAFARAHPDRVSSLSFIAACVWDGRPDSGARAISKALINGMREAAFRWRPLSRFMIEDILGPKRFAPFIERHFKEAGPDAAIIARELRSWPGAERMRYALRTSLVSVRHDFLHQAELDWESAHSLGLPIIFHHGTEDRIHPITLIEALAASIPMARVHRVPGGGQLLYYKFFAPILERIASEMRNVERQVAP